MSDVYGYAQRSPHRLDYGLESRGDEKKVIGIIQTKDIEETAATKCSIAIIQWQV
jgi:hypothetical protein